MKSEGSDFESRSITSSAKMELLGLNPEDYDDLYSRIRGDEFQRPKILGQERARIEDLQTPNKQDYYTLGNFLKTGKVEFKSEKTGENPGFFRASREMEYLATGNIPSNNFPDCGNGKLNVMFFDGQGFGSTYKVLKSEEDELDVNLTGFDWSAIQPQGKDPLITACYFNGSIATWALNGGNLIDRCNFKDERFTEVSYSNDQRYAVGTAGGDLYVHDLSDSEKRINLSREQRHTNRVVSFKWSPSNPHVGYSNGWDDFLKIWDTRCPKMVDDMFTACPNTSSTFMDDKYIYSGALDVKNHLSVLDLRKMEFVEKKTLEVQVGQHEGSPNYRSLGIACMARHRSIPSIFVVSTVKNNSIKVLTRAEGSFEEILSFEAVPLQISGIVLDNLLERCYFVGERARGVLSFSGGVEP